MQLASPDLFNTSRTPPYAHSARHGTCTLCSTSGLHPPFLILAASLADGGLTLSSQHHKQGMPDRCGAHTMCGQDRLQSVKLPALVLLLLPLPVTPADHGEAGPYFGCLHAPVPHWVLIHIYRLPPCSLFAQAPLMSPVHAVLMPHAGWTPCQ